VAVATDLKTGDAVVLRDKGDIPLAIRASCTIPGIYAPVIDDEGRHLVDGGLVAVVPATFVRALGADIVIAVDVNCEGASFFGSSLTTLFGVILQSFLMVQKNFTTYQHSASDYVIKPRIGHIRWDQLRRADELITAGYEAGLESAPEILKLVETFKNGK
jgi:NTE family protein